MDGQRVVQSDQLKQWVTANPAQVRKFVYVDDLACRLEEFAVEWKAAAAASKSKKVSVYVGELLTDLAGILAEMSV